MARISITEKIGLLRSTELFSKLTGEELEIVAYNSQMVRYKRGTIIFTEESHSYEMYVIKSGEVLITKRRYNDEIHIARFIEGESFGERDLIGNTPHNATAVALEDMEALVFPREGITLTMIFHKYPAMSSRILYKLLGIIAKRIRRTNRLINEKTPWMQKLKKQMMVDKLTGLFNRNFLFDDFDTMLSRTGFPISLLIIKPDNFKEINDRYGHYAGDQILVLISIFIGSALREDDIVIRYDGDEFAVVLPGASREEAIRIAKELGTAIYGMETGTITGEPGQNLTLSIGIATYPVHGTDVKTLLKLSYEKMLKAINSGGNRIIAAR
jgi:diguanylate cyclase (GGDEF)-like protein